MEMDLNSVIEKIKSEGVEKAEQEARDIITDAEGKAARMIEDARKKSEEMVKKAGQEAEDLKKNGEAALKQASRDVIIALRTKIIALMDSVIKKEVAKQLSPDVLKEIITNMVTTCGLKEKFDIEILLSEGDKQKLRGVLEGLLQKELKQGVVIKASPSLKHGFRVGEKDKNVYYDFSDEAIAETFNFYLNKKVQEIIDSGVHGAE